MPYLLESLFHGRKVCGIPSRGRLFTLQHLHGGLFSELSAVGNFGQRRTARCSESGTAVTRSCKQGCWVQSPLRSAASTLNISNQQVKAESVTRVGRSKERQLRSDFHQLIKTKHALRRWL